MEDINSLIKFSKYDKKRDLDFINNLNKESNLFLNNIYIIYISDEKIGAFSLDIFPFGTFVRFALVPKFRGKKLGEKIFKEVCDFLFKINPELKSLNVQILFDNKPMLIISNRIGFVKNHKLAEIFEEEGIKNNTILGKSRSM